MILKTSKSELPEKNHPQKPIFFNYFINEGLLLSGPEDWGKHSNLMKNQLKERLEQLQAEYKKGEERLAVLEQEAATVKTSMLRISGAVQVLQELLEKEENEEQKEEK